MSYKSRSNWRINFCLKFDCVNRKIKCEECIRFSNYKKEQNETNSSKNKEV